MYNQQALNEIGQMKVMKLLQKKKTRLNRVISLFNLYPWTSLASMNYLVFPKEKKRVNISRDDMKLL